jgi:hypothetical protein
MATVKRIYFRDVDLSKLVVKPNEKSKSALGKEYSHFYPNESGQLKPFKFLCDEQQLVWGIQLEYMEKEEVKEDKDRSRGFQIGCCVAPITKTVDGVYVCEAKEAEDTLVLFEFQSKCAARILELVREYNPKANYESFPVRSPHERDSEKPENYTLHGKLAGTGADVKPGTPREEFECWSSFRDEKNNIMTLDQFVQVSKAACVIPTIDCSSSFCAKKNNALSLRVRGDEFTLTIRGGVPGERTAPIVDISRAKRSRIAPVEEETEVQPEPLNNPGQDDSLVF